MEASNKDKKAVPESNKNKAYQRRSLNSGIKSKNLQQDPSIIRGHVSQLLQAETTKTESANKTENVMASLQKHRNGKSVKKDSSENIHDNVSKTDGPVHKSMARSKNKVQNQTIRDGEKWVSAGDTHREVISLIEDEENQNSKQNSKEVQSMKKERNESKKKTEINSDNKNKQEQEQNKQQSKPKSAKKSKSAAKSKGKKSARKKNKQASELKRTKMADKQLTNDPQSQAESVKNRKKSSAKTNPRNDQ